MSVHRVRLTLTSKLEKISSTNVTALKLDIINRNKNPSLPLEKFFSETCSNLLSTHNLPVPHPTQSTGVIYFLYSIHRKEFFPGYTTNSAFQQLLSHIAASFNKDTRLNKWLFEAKAENLRVFVMKEVHPPTIDNLIDRERAWHY